MQLNKVPTKIYSLIDGLGWHNKTPLEALALIMSEAGEACNECRWAVVTKNYGEELADIILRTLDEAKVRVVDIEAEIKSKLHKIEIYGLSRKIELAKLK